MNRDLFLAILAMDSYNRGYGQGINNLPVQLNVTKLGNATITRQSDILPNTDGVAAGFYAIAYDVSQAGVDGLSGRVISYRGTDNLNPFSLQSDIWRGWLAGGDIIGFGLGAQAPLSIAFYKAVVGTDAEGNFVRNPFTTDITLTGHSLGGGLAERAFAANDNAADRRAA